MIFIIPCSRITCKVLYFKIVHGLIIDTPIGCLADFSVRCSVLAITYASHFHLTSKLACFAVSSTPSRNLSAAAFSWLMPSLSLKPMEAEVSRHKTVSKGMLPLAETRLLTEDEKKARSLHKPL